jgi:putative DNA primase/helicase
MAAEGIVVSLEERARVASRELHSGDGSAPSEDAMALAFVARHGREYRYVAPWHRWIRWEGKRWVQDSTGHVFALIRVMVREVVGGTRHERRIATAAYIAGVERLARYDQSIVIVPADLDADPWLLNTQAGIVDLRTGVVAPHDPAALMTRLTSAAPAFDQGAELWSRFLTDITQGDSELAAYLQRLAGYCATGMTSEDILPYFFGVGSNGKSSFAEALTAALGDYALVFAPEVLMEAKGERHPTELAQFLGVRLALCSEPSSSATWNDSRVKSLTGDTTISARFMRADTFTFRRTHKTLVVGNHMPKLNAVTQAIRRRMQMVPFRAVFASTPGAGMRERLKQEALGAVLAWAIAGAARWLARGTAPPEAVRVLTEDYLGEEDGFGQWLAENCMRDASGFERSSELHRNYTTWCEKNGTKPESNALLSRYLVGLGLSREKTMVGRCFHGLKLRQP